MLQGDNVILEANTGDMVEVLGKVTKTDCGNIQEKHM